MGINKEFRKPIFSRGKHTRIKKEGRLKKGR